MEYVETLDQLLAIYGAPVPTSLTKVADHLTPQYRRWIESSKFCILSTVGAAGTDATPRGDDGPVVRIVDSKRLLLPDWAGNNRVDSLRNLLEDNRASLMFFHAGANNVVRLNGTCRITADSATCALFAKKGQLPRTVLVFDLHEVYFQCAKALMRSRLWGGEAVADLPTAGDFLREMTEGAEGGAAYDTAYAARARSQFWTR